MNKLKRLVAMLLVMAVAFSYAVPVNSSYAADTLLAAASSEASSNASDNASSTASSTAASATSEAATTEASANASANATTEAPVIVTPSADASKDASTDASSNASANATGSREIIDVYVTFANAGKIVVANDADKTLMAYQKVKVTDVDNDGKLTAYDVFARADETFNLGGFKYGYNPAWGSDSIIKLFGVETSGVLYYINNQMAGGIYDTVTNGDTFVSYILKDTTTWSDQYIYFTPVSITAVPNVEADVNVFALGFDGTSTPVADADLVTVDSEGVLVTGIGAVGKTDASGNAKILFVNPGTYYVTAYALDASGNAKNYVPNVIKVTVEGEPEVITPAPSKPAKVTGVKAKVTKKKSKRSIKLSWKAVKGASSYQVYVSKNKSKGFKLAKSVSKKTLTITKKKGTYYVKVRAVNSAGKGSYSKVLKVKAK